MVAGPGTGKTWSSCQLMYHLAKAAVRFEAVGLRLYTYINIYV